MDVALVTCTDLPEPDFDEAPLAAALEAAGIASEVLAWDDPSADWSRARMTVLRSSWNYPLHRGAFLRWAESTAEVSDLWNPLGVVRWNSHKSYILDLERRLVPVTPTAFLPRGANVTLKAILEERGWDEVVVKPAVSAASFKTIRVGLDAVQAGEVHLGALLPERDMLVQEFLPSVEEYGERALVWIDGELTHAVRKTPRFEGEDESVSDAVEISPDEAALARCALQAIDAPLLYARVDVAPGRDGRFVLMELELIEPSLFFPQCGSALDRFVEGIRRRLAGSC